MVIAGSTEIGARNPNYKRSACFIRDGYDGRTRKCVRAWVKLRTTGGRDKGRLCKIGILTFHLKGVTYGANNGGGGRGGQ
jgi:hypothetical protein